jgi:serine/threonine protein kinase/tetratricopeptide (TPR) repeat protein
LLSFYSVFGHKVSSTRPECYGESIELATGDRIGRFVVLTMVGRGGMGEVYAAFDPDLDRKVAVKLLRCEAAGGVEASEGRARMLREAQTIARLSDPNVVTVYDVGTFDGRVFLAMEFVDGHTLSYWLHARPRTWREILDCYRAAGRGLASAHRSGVVHRDFKPDNVMVGHDGGVRVMDFGLARTVVKGSRGSTTQPPPDLVGHRVGAAVAPIVVTTTLLGLTAADPGPPVAPPGAPHAPAPAVPAGPREAIEPSDDAAGATRDLARPFTLSPLSRSIPGVQSSAPTASDPSGLTESGAMMGTPAYMSAEQLHGKETDARSDQFSFCVALYEGLYGTRPFPGRTVDEIFRSVVAGDVRDAPAGSKVPSWVRRVVLRGLRPDREDRYASMEALLAALERDPVRQARVRWAAGAAVGAVFAGVLGGLVALGPAQQTRCRGAEGRWAGVWDLPTAGGGVLSPRKQAIQAAFVATGKRYAADSFAQVRRFLDDYVVAWNEMHREACEASNVRGEQSAEVLDLRMGCLRDRFTEVRALTAVFTSADGEVVSKAVEATQAIRPLEPCADVGVLKAMVRQPEAPALRRRVAELRASLADARAMTRAGRYTEALTRLGQVLPAAEKTGYPPVIAETHLQTGELELALGRANGQAEAHLEQAVWLAEASRHDEVAAEAAVSLIPVVGYRASRTSEAERWGHLSEAVLSRMGPGHDILRAWRLNNLAMLYARLGRPSEALEAFEQAVALKARAFGPVHVDVAISEANAAFALFELGRSDEALRRNQRALEVFAQTTGLEHPRAAFALGNAAEILRAKGRFAESRAMAERALEVLRRESPGALLAGDHRVGREAGPDDRTAAEGAPFDVGSDAAEFLVTLGRDWLSEGDAARAVPLLEQAVTLRPEGRRHGAEFALAEALWATPRGGGRALEAARAAALDAAGAGTDPEAERQRALINAWIEERTRPEPPITMR